jgi:hypothetical protein
MLRRLTGYANDLRREGCRGAQEKKYFVTLALACMAIREARELGVRDIYGRARGELLQERARCPKAEGDE